MSKSEKTSKKQKPPSNKYKFHIEDIDPRIRPLVLALNNVGYETLFSCSGHESDIHGYVTIKGYKKKKKLEAFLKSFGLAEFEIQYDPPMSTTVRLPHIGGSKGHRIIPRLELVIPKETRGTILRLFRRNLHRLGIHVASKRSTLLNYALSEALSGNEVSKQ